MKQDTSDRLTIIHLPLPLPVMSYATAVPITATATVTAVDGAPPEYESQYEQGPGQNSGQGLGQGPGQGLSSAIAGFGAAAINLGSTIFREARDAYNENVTNNNQARKKAGSAASSSSSSSSSIYRRMTRGDPPPPSTQYTYAQPSSELQKQIEMSGQSAASVQENIKQNAKCWFGFSAPAEPGCTSCTLKTVCILPAVIAYILGLVARGGDNIFVCICAPCVASTYGTYKMGEAAATLTVSASEILASGNQNNSRNAGAIIANRTSNQIQNTQREMSAFAECIMCFDQWQKWNGLVLCPPCCGCCGMCCAGGNPWPRSSYDLHGNCLEAPCQVCFMDIHIPIIR